MLVLLDQQVYLDQLVLRDLLGHREISVLLDLDLLVLLVLKVYKEIPVRLGLLGQPEVEALGQLVRLVRLEVLVLQDPLDQMVKVSILEEKFF
jgi:hypothetical protein